MNMLRDIGSEFVHFIFQFEDKLKPILESVTRYVPGLRLSCFGIAVRCGVMFFGGVDGDDGGGVLVMFRGDGCDNTRWSWVLMMARLARGGVCEDLGW